VFGNDLFSTVSIIVFIYSAFLRVRSLTSFLLFFFLIQIPLQELLGICGPKF